MKLEINHRERNQKKTHYMETKQHATKKTKKKKKITTKIKRKRIILHPKRQDRKTEEEMHITEKID